MKAERVAIIYQFPLIGRAISQLLDAADDIEVVACVPDDATALTQILPLHPDVVIKVSEDGLASTPLPLQLPEKELRLIYLRSAGNELSLIKAQQMTITDVEDLFRVIRTREDVDRAEPVRV